MNKMFPKKSLIRQMLKFRKFYLNEKSTLPSLENRAQKFKHAFCHRALFNRSVLKAELTFEPYSLMKVVNIFFSFKRLKNLNTVSVFLNMVYT